MLAVGPGRRKRPVEPRAACRERAPAAPRGRRSGPAGLARVGAPA